jgi:hypothetical protein
MQRTECLGGIKQYETRETSMGAVMVKCPETGHDIPTGIVTDRKSFDASPVFFARVYCPICRTNHEWFAKQGWVCEAGVPARSFRKGEWRPAESLKVAANM